MRCSLLIAIHVHVCVALDLIVCQCIRVLYVSRSIVTAQNIASDQHAAIKTHLYEHKCYLYFCLGWLWYWLCVNRVNVCAGMPEHQELNKCVCGEVNKL